MGNIFENKIQKVEDKLSLVRRELKISYKAFDEVCLLTKEEHADKVFKIRGDLNLDVEEIKATDYWRGR